MKRLLAIETSCDETAVAILEGCSTLLASQVASQIAAHAAYGGVVPEVASRQHLALLPEVLKTALAQAQCSLADIDAFAATVGPGLASALLVGVSATKGMALAAGKPFIPVNHMEGHLLSPFFGQESVPSHIGLVVSGGHTLLVRVDQVGSYQILGTTLDDAAGEAFDKVGKLLGLGYPGGVEIDRLARDGDPGRFDFPRGMLDSADFNFSFSGLKTAVRYTLEKSSQTLRLPDVCASFQAAVVDVLVAKTIRAAKVTGTPAIALSGGVSSNSTLRSKLQEACRKEQIDLFVAPPSLRTDNAAMIAYVAALKAKNLLDGSFGYEADICPNFQGFSSSSSLCSI